MRCETQGRVEGRHWIETPVESEHKFVEVRRQVLMTHSVMRAEQPGRQVREGDVDHWQVGIGSLWGTINHHGLVRVTQLGQIVVAVPTIGAHNSALCHIVLHEPRESLGASVWHKAQSPSARADGSLRRFAVGVPQWPQRPSPYGGRRIPRPLSDRQQTSHPLRPDTAIR